MDGEELRHTPGPWKAVKGLDLHGDEDGQDEHRCSVVVDGPKQFFVATIENGAPGDTCESEYANALLIAAAPELLAACRKALAGIIHDNGPAAPNEEVSEIELGLRDAIAKALGKGA